MTFTLLENIDRKSTKEGKTWRTKIAHKFRQAGVSMLDNVDSVQPAARVFGVSLEKSVPSRSNEVFDYYQLLYLVFYCHSEPAKSADSLKDNCAMFAPTPLFSAPGYPMVSLKFFPCQPPLPWQRILGQNWL